LRLLLLAGLLVILVASFLEVFRLHGTQSVFDQNNNNDNDDDDDDNQLVNQSNQ